jgi:hypothetical protein
MKKPLIFFILAASAALSGCDALWHIDWVVENRTESEIVITTKRMGESNSIVIAPDDKQLIYFEEDLGDPGGLPDDDGYGYQGPVLTDAKIMIDNNEVPDEIWLRKYWIFTKNSKYNGTYTLTITDELIETIQSDNSVVN